MLRDIIYPVEVGSYLVSGSQYLSHRVVFVKESVGADAAVRVVINAYTVDMDIIGMLELIHIIFIT